MSYRILLVEPDLEVASAAAAVLMQLGYRVATVDSLEEATRYSESHLPDLLIVALRLGAFNGLQLLIRIHALERGIPAIVLGTASDFTGDVASFGAHFLLKPLDTTLLPGIMAGLLEGRTSRDPQSERTWPRKRAQVPALVYEQAAQIVDLSYGGVRLALPQPPSVVPSPLEIKLPGFGMSMLAVARWARPADNGLWWWCGAEMRFSTSHETRLWQGVVSSLN